VSRALYGLALLLNYTAVVSSSRGCLQSLFPPGRILSRSVFIGSNLALYISALSSSSWARVKILKSGRRIRNGFLTLLAGAVAHCGAWLPVFRTSVDM
jgi:hypothetical protein